MTRNVYVMAMAAGTGKSVVVLGLAEVLSRWAGRLALFRPMVAATDPRDPDIELIRCHYELPQDHRGSFALTAGDLHDVDGRPGYERLLSRVLDRAARAAAGADFVLLEGSDFTSASPLVELDLNVDAARNLAAPVLLVVGGRNRSADEVLDAAHQGAGVLADRGCTVLGVVCNRVGGDQVDAVRAGLPAAVGEVPGGVLPEVPLLAAPTVAEIADRLGARSLVAPAAPREANRVIVGAMGLPAFLDRLADGDLVITPGDRSDLVAGILAAHTSAAYPAVAGLLLTGGLVAEPVRRMARGFEGAGIPVLAVDTDTYDTAAAVREVRGAIGVDSARKIATAIALFEDHVDHERLRERLAVAHPMRITPLMFQQQLLERARADRRHIVLPESGDERILRAAEQLLLRGVAELTLLGCEDDVRARAAALGVDVTAARVVDPVASPWRKPFARVYAEMRRHRGVAEPVALDLMTDPTYFGTMMVQQGQADGLVSGAAHTTAHTIRPAFEVIRTAPGVSLVSSAFFMCLADRVLVYADCAVVPNPTAEQLADIAISAAGTAALFGIEPRVAMLSYATGESGSGSDVEHVRRATALVRQRAPELPVEGPVQYDAAVDPGVARTKLPGSTVAGQATVLVFPDLNTGNNTYEAVQRSAGAVAIGPVLQGLTRPVNDLSRGATVTDIVNTVAITAIQAQRRG